MHTPAPGKADAKRVRAQRELGALSQRKIAVLREEASLKRANGLSRRELAILDRHPGFGKTRESLVSMLADCAMQGRWEIVMGIAACLHDADQAARKGRKR